MTKMNVPSVHRTETELFPGLKRNLSNLSLYYLLFLFYLTHSSLTKHSPFVGAQDGESINKSQVLDCTTVTGNRTNSLRGDLASICGEEPYQTNGSHSDRSLNSGSKQEKSRDATLLECAPTGQTVSGERKVDGDEIVPLVVCSPPKANIDDQSSSILAPKPIELFIETIPSNLSGIKSGSTLLARCKFNAVIPNQDIKFSLRWLRSVANGTHGQLKNESIPGEPDITVRDNLDRRVGGNRLSTVQLDGGLNLEIRNFQPSDSGEYFCRAVSTSPDNQADEPSQEHDSRNKWRDPKIIDEKKIQVVSESLNQESTNHEQQSGRERQQYSQENLLKLLPSLIVIPSAVDLGPGESVQLACVTNELDPEPEPPDQLVWSFLRPRTLRQTLDAAPELEPTNQNDQLPPDTTVSGNMLSIWNMSRHHEGLYTCAFTLDDFNLTAQATSEVYLRPESDAAPLVFVSPELIRLSVGGSAKIQCEATGYPVPQLEWYRVDSIQASGALGDSSGGSGGAGVQATTSRLTDDSPDGSLRFDFLDRLDSLAYCKQSDSNCVTAKRSSGRAFQSHQFASAVSLIHLERARSEHQGQYVCKASNKHGSNQAHSFIDVEFKEKPLVKIDAKHERQTIVLPSDEALSSPGPTQAKAVFRCRVVAGRPKPRLRWLRAPLASTARVSSNTQLLNKSAPTSSQTADLDDYDLARVSSATSRVSTWAENEGKTLALELSTVSVEDEGEYVCLAENELGRHSVAAHLAVRKPASVRIVQTSPKVAQPNESFQLDCRVSGHPAPLDIEWSRSDRGAFFALISNQPAPQERAVLKFDRVSSEDAGEYTCAAHDPLNSSLIVRDTIMVIIESQDGPQLTQQLIEQQKQLLARQLPKLMIRPTKVSLPVGSNITLDCLAISGLQPTIVEWLAPARQQQSMVDGEPTGGVVSIKPYYRSSLNEQTNSHLLQFGSKLRIFNASKIHEGIYQCRGHNRAGTENAPALIKILDEPRPTSTLTSKSQLDHSDKTGANLKGTTKTKVAHVGSNIELRCQVTGLEQQPATSWSRDGKELPKSSVQLNHNLWIQNLTKSDEGLYLCSARSNEPNQVIQAKINLLVREFHPYAVGALAGSGRPYNPQVANVSARIVASKSALSLGDSVTLECMLKQNSDNNSSEIVRLQQDELDELERQVLWTNLRSGQNLFQDNVYIQDNLLIIYGVRSENVAVYRCNYNELTQHVDYQLQVLDSDGNPFVPESPLGSLVSDRTTDDSGASNETRVIQVPPGTRLTLECAGQASKDPVDFVWSRGVSPNLSIISGTRSLNRIHLDVSGVQQANLYQCHQKSSGHASTGAGGVISSRSFVVQVPTTSTRFLQQQVSFVILPAASMATPDRRVTEIEVKFLPERDHGMILFSGGANIGVPHSLAGPIDNADFVSLGLNRGLLEFRFELGDGVTLVRSSQALSLNRWHRVIIERNWRNCTMWIDGQKAQSRMSAGKFLDLNLDNSVLFVGGHQIFANFTTAAPVASQRFYGYSNGLQGCISYLRVNGRELDITARDRVVSQGVFECDKHECSHFADCLPPNGFCQVDRDSDSFRRRRQQMGADVDRRALSSAEFDLRCICAPNRTGSICGETAVSREAIEALFSNPTIPTGLGQSANRAATATAPRLMPTPSVLGPCEQQTAKDSAPPPVCNPNGTAECQSLTSISHKCHCNLGFVGDQCEQKVSLVNETSIRFNPSAFLHFEFVPAPTSDQLIAADDKQQRQVSASEFAQLTSFTEQLNVSLSVQTRSSFGLLFYVGGAQMDSTTASPRHRRDTSPIKSQPLQTTKSVVANLLARLASAPAVSSANSSGSSAKATADFMAIALVDGHVELSYELGSGPAIIRSTRRINDGALHKIEARRTNRQGALLIDASETQAAPFKYEGQSPGRLSMLNTSPDIYIGGLPRLAPTASSSSALLVSSFSGCISQLQINSLGPLNLIRASQMTRIKQARNLAPCNEPEPVQFGALDEAVDQQQQQQQQNQLASSSATTSAPSTRRTPPKYSDSDPDDSDEP